MEFLVPEKIEDIKELVGNRRAYYIAGGTDIMVKRKEFTLNPEFPWVDISGFDGLKGIKRSGNYLEIGALATMADIAENSLVKEKAPAVSRAAAQMGSPLIRNLATIGGNIANSNPAGDLIPPLYALDAELALQKGEHKRVVPVNEFCLGPCHNILGTSEIITAVKIPLLEGENSAFLKIGPRKALAISKVSAAVWWFEKDDEMVDIRIALGAVGPTCIRAGKTEALLKGKKISRELIEEARETIVHEVCPIDDFRSSKEYRAQMTGVLLKRILENRKG